jgi:L-threo-3-deoxy-hexylosonate aldolase
MGEANHLSNEERLQVIKAARIALDDAGYTSVPIVAGTGLGSTKETLKLTIEAAKVGADYAIVIPSGYFAGAIANDRAGLKRFFKDIAEASPIPVIVYNCTYIPCRKSSKNIISNVVLSSLSPLLFDAYFYRH